MVKNIVFDLCGVYSFEIGTTKPNKNNYKILLEKYNLLPEETIFIDDRQNNVEETNNFGIHAIQFVTLDLSQFITLILNNERLM